MSKEKLYIFDTTLRDGAQTEGVDFSVEDKNKVAKKLSEIGIDYIEGGWPGANPVDTEFFSKPLDLNKSIFTAFGMTKKTGRSAEDDPSLSSLLNASCSAICVVGKAWDFHVKTALEIKNEDNLENIKDTAKHIVKNGKELTRDKVNVFDFISVKGIKAIGNQLSKKQLKEINLLDPIPYEPEIKELNEIEVVDEQDDDRDDDSNENGQSQIKLEF